MTVVVPNESELTVLKNFLNIEASQDLVLRLFVNDYTPDESSIETDFTEASGLGYAAITIDSSEWSLSASNPSTAALPQKTFTFSGSLGFVYGYYVTQEISGKLMWAERFSIGPFNVQYAGDQIRLIVEIALE